MAKPSVAKINKKTSAAETARAAIEAACEEKNYNPFKELIDLATQTHTIVIKTSDGDKEVETHVLEVSDRIAIAKEVASYLAPKLKSIEVQQEIDGKLEITVKTFNNTGTQLAIEEGSKED